MAVAQTGSEKIALISKREENAKDGIFQFRQCFLPTFRFAGKSLFLVQINELIAHGRKWLYSAYNYRSTFLKLHPTRTKEAKGLIVYHTSIMLLSVAEKLVVESFRKWGWNILVGLPSDSLYRTRLPALASSRGTIQNGRAIGGGRHGPTLPVAGKQHPRGLAIPGSNPARVATWKTGAHREKRRHFWDAGGNAHAPVVDALIFISGGTNLLSLYESGYTGVFSDSWEWINDARHNPPTEVTRIFSDKEYHELYQRASTVTIITREDLPRCSKLTGS